MSSFGVVTPTSLFGGDAQMMYAMSNVYSTFDNSLGYNNIDAAGAKDLATMLESNTSIHTLE